MLFQGLSIGVEGGINRYLATRLDCGSGVSDEYNSEDDQTVV